MRFGIVTPSLNQGRFIEEAIQSVLSQEAKEIQISYAVMDGGSDDNTLEVISKYSEQLSHFESKQDDGQAAAISDGFALIDGDIFAYINSDDFYFPGTFAKVKRIFEDNAQVDFVYSNRLYVDDQGRVNGCWKLPTHSSWLMSKWDYIPQETLFWRKSIMNRVGAFDRTLNFCMDYDFLIRLMRAGKGLRVNDFFGAFRMHPESKTVMLYSTVGIQEIGFVQKKYSLRIPPVVGFLLKIYIRLVSSTFWLFHKREYSK
jgi:glycosyltransferase involved in cell wall biosynthesis